MSDFASLTVEQIERLIDKYKAAGMWVDGHGRMVERLQREIDLRAEEPYQSCPDCGADMYDDGTHVLDRIDRAMNGNLPCREL